MFSVADGQDNPDEGRRMIDAIRKVTNQPIRYLINASPHGDHVNSNDVFEAAIVVAHENARAAMQAAAGRAAPNSIRPRLPGLTFKDAIVQRFQRCGTAPGGAVLRMRESIIRTMSAFDIGCHP